MPGCPGGCSLPGLCQASARHRPSLPVPSPALPPRALRAPGGHWAARASLGGSRARLQAAGRLWGAAASPRPPETSPALLHRLYRERHAFKAGSRGQTPGCCQHLSPPPAHSIRPLGIRYQRWPRGTLSPSLCPAVSNRRHFGCQPGHPHNHRCPPAPHTLNTQQPQGKLPRPPRAPVLPGPAPTLAHASSKPNLVPVQSRTSALAPLPVAGWHCLALPGTGTRAGARQRGTRSPCPGTERWLGWCLCSGEGQGQPGPVVAPSILPGGFTPHPLNALSREILENQPVLHYPRCARLSWCWQSWSPCQPASPCPLPAPGAGLASGRRCHGAGHCLLHAPTPSPSSAVHRGGNTAGLQQGPRDPAGRMLVPGSLQPRGAEQPRFTPPARWAQAALAAPAPAGEAGAGSPVSQSRPTVPERDEPAARARTLLFPSVLREHFHGADE